MIHNVNNLFVEIDGELFPAGNIQIWEESPELHFSEEHNVWYGIFFEMMFETGYGITVSQEAAEIINEECDGECTKDDLDHFLVMITHNSTNHTNVEFAYHITGGEEELARVLKNEQVFLSKPTILSAVHRMVA